MLKCPDCNNKDNLIRKGPIPLGSYDSREDQTQLFFEGAYYFCQKCYLGFRWPRPSAKKLEQFYEFLKNETWSSLEIKKREDWIFAHRVINENFKAGNLLDVGCFDGEFLKNFSNDYKKFGIELNLKAKNEAEKNGIQIISDSLDSLELKNHKFKFNAICAFDVIEHTQQPLNFVRKLLELLESDGILIIASGNSEALSWRLMGSRYWYPSVPGHISFICSKWSKNITRQLKLKIIEEKKYRHEYRNFIFFLKELMLNGLYKIMPKFFLYLRNITFKNKTKAGIEPSTFPPYFLSAKDHIIVAFKKNL